MDHTNEAAKEKRKEWAKELEEIVEITKNIQKGLCEPEKLQQAIQIFKRLNSETKRLELEKRTSQKVLSGRLLIT